MNFFKAYMCYLQFALLSQLCTTSVICTSVTTLHIIIRDTYYTLQLYIIHYTLYITIVHYTLYIIHTRDTLL